MTTLAHSSNPLLTFYALSEKAITVVFGDRIDLEISKKIRSLDRALHLQPFPGMITTVVAYTTLCIHYDPTLLRASISPDNNLLQDWILDYLSSLMEQSQDGVTTDIEEIIIPVCYGGVYGPDLQDVAAHTGLSMEEIMEKHTNNAYTVYMMGFMPGFPYLGGLDQHLATPRKETPRQMVPHGSVGIAGTQTGVYPLDSPGGWQIIGRTPLRLFDPASEHSILLKSGQQIRFESMDHGLFEQFERDYYGHKNS